MLVFKYNRLGDARYIPHVDMLRHLQRIIRRAGLEVDFSEGFNPHMLLYMSAPIPVGTASEAEYFCAASGMNAKDFAQRFNASSIEGVRITAAAALPKNPNLAAIVRAADYVIEARGVGESAKAITALLTPDFAIKYTTSKGEVTKPVRDKILSLSVDKDYIKARLSCGQDNLRADRLATALLEAQGLFARSIIKKKVYTEQNGKLVPLDLALMLNAVHSVEGSDD